MSWANEDGIDELSASDTLNSNGPPETDNASVPLNASDTILNSMLPPAAAAAASIDPFVLVVQMMAKMEEDRRADQERFLAVIQEMSTRSGNGQNSRRMRAENVVEEDDENVDAAEAGNQRERSKARTNLRPPPMIEKDITYSAFKSWTSAWNNYAKATNLETCSREEQVATFLNNCSAGFLHTLEYVLEIKSNTPMTVKEVIAAIQQHLRGQQNIVVDRYRWLHRRQGASESFDEFHAALMELTEDADVASMQVED